MPDKYFLVCVDCMADISKNKWSCPSEEYECRVVDNSREALSIACVRQVDAIVTSCSAAAIDIVMHLYSYRRETPIFILGQCEVPQCTPCDFSVAAETIPDIPNLLASLRQRLPWPGKFPIVPNLYHSDRLQWPISVLAGRDGKVVGFEGRTVAVGKGGVYGKFAGTLDLGEKVLIDFVNSPDGPLRHAQVLCRIHDIYGLAFEEKKL